VRALKQDSDGTLWIGTYDSGLGRFKDGRFTRFTTRDGLFDNGVFQILEDDHGRFWMSCNRGIYRVRKRELNDLADGRIKTVTCLAYTKGDGLPSTECNGGRWPAGVRTRDGRLWFPTMLGVAMIDPSSIDANTQPPPVVLEGMRINNQPAPFDVWKSALHDPECAIRIEPGQDTFEIEYTALSFINSENLRFKYMLVGADHDWVDADTRRTAYYSYVPPGDYTFKVIAANADGVWNEMGASVRITIVPPFWRTWWFTTLCALAVAGALAGAWRYREVRLQRMQMAQQDFARRLIESQETERKRIAAELHDSLGQNLLIVKNRALINAMTLPDESARTQFDEFSTAVSQSIEEVRSIAHGLRPPHLDQLGLRTALVAMIEKVAASSAITFAHSLDDMDNLFRPDDEILLYRIVQECLNNVLKHSGASAAEVNVIVDENRFTLTVGDNGRGFTPDDRSTGRPGLGLQGIAERVRILGGVHQVVSSPGHGTTIVVTVELADRKSGTGATG
jgi:signal transduction histidine kinase